MKNYLALTLIGLATVPFFTEPNPGTSSERSERIEARNKHRGVSWVASRSVAEDDFIQLVDNNVSWIAQTPFGWQQNYDSPRFEFARGGRVRWGERDQGLETTTSLARKYGIKTLLKPHIWLRNRDGGKWRTDIEMGSDAEWRSWFESYRQFILHYARLAEKNDIEVLSVGTELHMTVKKRPDDWRRIIAEVRQVYNGKLTYSANWYQEFEDVRFWDELDFIGIQGYFPLTQQENPTVEELKRGWQTHITAIERIQRKYRKPVLFTEIGYKSTTDSAIKPWEWLRSTETPAELGLQTQANCYEAFFQSLWHKEWFAGAYIWKWFPSSRMNSTSGRRSRRGVDRFTPQNKPAEIVMAKWYGTAIE